MFLFLSLTFVSAQDVKEDTQKFFSEVSGFIDGAVEGLNPFLKHILGENTGIPDDEGGIYSPGAILFAKFLFLIIILGIIYTAFSRIDFFNEHLWVLWLISISVSILSVRFIGSTLVPMILLPYNALGVVISAAAPFMAYFIIINIGLSGRAYQAIRRVAWIFFGVVFIFLWFTRTKSIMGSASWIYPVTAALSFIMILFDGTWSRFYNKMKLERRLKPAQYLRYKTYSDKLEQVEEALADAIAKGDSAAQATLRKERKNLVDALSRIK
jgi:hypothetical protein